MLENPTDSSSSTPNISTIKRYAPPNQRNRSLGRRKSGGDRFERAQNNMNDTASRNVPILDHGDASGSNLASENPRPALIPLHGCCNSGAFRLLNDRWAAAMNAYNNPSIDLAERPVMYSGSGAPAWGQFRLPHQLLPPAAGVGPSGSQMDFLAELRQAMHNASVSSDT
ncbi:hypothetical protein LguiA_020733 [Lonicera macranthoides]